MKSDNRRKHKDFEMGPNFFQTMMGKRFFEGTIPAMLSQIKRLNDNLEKIISLLENNETAFSKQPFYCKYSAYPKDQLPTLDSRTQNIQG